MYQQVLSDSSSFQGCNPWDSSKQLSEEMYGVVLVAVMLTMTSLSKHLFSIILLAYKFV